MAEPARRCASGPRCARAERDRSSPTHRLIGAALWTPLGLCWACERRVAVVVGELPQDVADLTAEMGVTVGGATVGTRVRATRGNPTPIRLGLHALRHRIVWESEYWAECLGMETLHAVRLPSRISRVCDYLAPRVREMVALGPQERTVWADGEPVRDKQTGEREMSEVTGLTGAKQLLQLHAWTRACLGRTKLVHRLPAPCPWCDHQALVRHDGDSSVSCEHCGKRIKERDYNWFVKITLAEEQRQAAAAQSTP